MSTNCCWQPLMKELGEMEKVNSQLSAAIEEVTREHREKAEVKIMYANLICFDLLFFTYTTIE